MLFNFVKAQDPQFSQPYASALYLNPALTGDTKKNRLALTYRNQWTAIENGFTSYIVSFDRRIKKVNSGIGGYIMYDQAGPSGYRVTGLNFSYSYNARINSWSGLRGGVSAGYSFMNYNSNDLLFADQVIRNGAPTSVEEDIRDNTSYLDLSAGLLYYRKFVWVGFSSRHLNQPNISMIDQVDRLAIRYSIHGGVKLWNKRNVKKVETGSLSIATHYKFQADWDQLDLGVYYNFHPLVIGLWYRGIPLLKSYDQNFSNHESLILLVGLEYSNQLRVAYSYDFTISELSMKSGGSHELSLIYEWPNKSKSKYKRKIACPKF